ncbi:MAG: HpcH/HpaI aldolase family protein [Actinomycetota bacterium]
MTVEPIRRRTKIAVWIDKPDTLFCDLLIEAGIDIAIIDCEHGSFSQESVWDLITLLGTGGVAPFVRVPVLSRSNIMQPLDWGAEALIIPGIRTVEEVAQAIEYSTYPPAGSRGWGPRRAALLHRAQIDRAHHIKSEQQRRPIWVQIETADALINLDAIVATPGLGGVLVGPMDLSGDTVAGLGNVNHPDMTAAIQRVTTTATAEGLSVGVAEPNASPDVFAQRVDSGCELISIGTQFGLISSALQTRLDAVKASLASNSE